VEPHVVEKLERIWETVNSPGWADIEQDLKEKVEQMKVALVTDMNADGDLLKVAQGRVLSYNEILSLYDVVKYALDNKDAETTEDA